MDRRVSEHLRPSSGGGTPSTPGQKEGTALLEELTALPPHPDGCSNPTADRPSMLRLEKYKLCLASATPRPRQNTRRVLWLFTEWITTGEGRDGWVGLTLPHPCPQCHQRRPPARALPVTHVLKPAAFWNIDQERPNSVWGRQRDPQSSMRAATLEAGRGARARQRQRGGSVHAWGARRGEAGSRAGPALGRGAGGAVWGLAAPRSHLTWECGEDRALFSGVHGNRQRLGHRKF